MVTAPGGEETVILPRLNPEIPGTGVTGAAAQEVNWMGLQWRLSWVPRGLCLLPQPEVHAKQRDGNGAKVVRFGTGFGVALTILQHSRQRPGLLAGEPRALGQAEVMR